MYAGHDVIALLEAPVRAGAFLFPELLLWVVMPSPHLVPLERPPQPELGFRAQRAHLPPRLCGQYLAQVVIEADREAPILVRIVSHRNLRAVWRPLGAVPME